MLFWKRSVFNLSKEVIPEHEIVDLEYQNDDLYVAEVIADPKSKKQDIELIAKSIINSLRKPYFYTILFFHKKKSDAGGKFTLARVWWGKRDKDYDSIFWRWKRYRKYKMEITLKEELDTEEALIKAKRIKTYQIEIRWRFKVIRISDNYFNKLTTGRNRYGRLENPLEMDMYWAGGGDCFRMDGFAGAFIVATDDDNYYLLTPIDSRYNDRVFTIPNRIKIYSCTSGCFVFDFENLKFHQVNPDTNERLGDDIDFSKLTIKPDEDLET